MGWGGAGRGERTTHSVILTYSFVSRFWGLPTDAEKQRRLEDFLRKQFEARIRYQRAMMVAVGGEIATSKAFEKRVPDILRIEKYRITKLL